jgi:hypothetical protein
MVRCHFYLNEAKALHFYGLRRLLEYKQSQAAAAKKAKYKSLLSRPRVLEFTIT